MTSLTNRITTLVLLIWLCGSTALCPVACMCGLDDRGRRKTSCVQGGLIGPLPVASIARDTQVLKISAPKGNRNRLQINAATALTLTNLEELHLVRSNILEIGRHTFWGAKHLLVLNLSENNISGLHEHNFRGLANLHELYVNENCVTQLQSGCFKSLTELRVLSLAHNRLSELVTRVFERLGKLYALNLSGNRLTELQPEVFMDIQELRVLECRRCGLRNINEQIYHLLSHLTTLDLGENDFFYLPADKLHDLHQLRQLWLDGNHLPVVLENTFEMQRRLEFVSLARNRLAKITSAAFMNLTALTSLDISYNKLYRIDALTFRPLASLERLEIGGNNLGTLDLMYGLTGLGRLEHLGLTDLNWTTLPLELVQTHREIRSLNLSGNHLELVPAQVWLFPQLAHLDLSRNRLTSFDRKTLSHLNQLKSVRLHQNPWNCDQCHIGSLLDKLNRTNLVCATPDWLRGRTTKSLNQSELVGCNVDNVTPESQTATYSAIVIVSLTICVCLTSVVTIIKFYRYRRRQQPDNLRPEISKCSAPETTVIFERNGEINFKFPVDVQTRKKVTISTIDDVKQQQQRLKVLSINGDVRT